MPTQKPYSVTAANLSWASENKIHDDAVAKRFGFTGGLVPGVEVFAYAAHAAVDAYGKPWLERGVMEMKFAAPVYDGAVATVTATSSADRLAVAVESGGKSCAAGEAWLPAKQPAAPLPTIVAAAPPPAENREPANDDNLAIGRTLATRPLVATAEISSKYLADIRETAPIFAAETIIHPGWLLRRCNAVLVENLIMPAWIHVGSRMQLLSIARFGETVTVHAASVANYDRKGHRFVELDCLVSGDKGRPLAQVRHTAIYRLRGETH